MEKGKDGKFRGKKSKKVDVFEVDVGEKGMEGIREARDGRVDRDAKRTRGGRVERRRRRLGLMILSSLPWSLEVETVLVEGLGRSCMD